MPKRKRKDFLQNKISERLELKKKISKLSVERNKYVQEKRQETNAPSPATMNEAVTSAIQKQGAIKNYIFKK